MPKMNKPLTPQQLWDVELPRARRGFEELATRKILAEAAGALSAVTRERDDLRKEVDELKQAPSQATTDAETIGAVLVTAQGVADDLVARAKEEAAAIRAEAESKRDEAYGRAQAEAQEKTSEALARIEALRREDEELRQTISLHRQEFVTFLHSALAQLERVESFAAGAEPAGLDGELLSRLSSE
jgi:cell division septum initiation protein DivIVA